MTHTCAVVAAGHNQQHNTPNDMSASRSVAVAMSGGVDSSVAALLLKKAGWHVTGVFMVNWDEMDERGVCSAEDDYRMVTSICRHIGISCRRATFVKEYWNNVFSDLLEGYSNGRTPNPDVLCNQRIKFGVFHKHVMRSLGVNKMATGHYAQLQSCSSGVRMLQAVDKFKDQTYFLATVPQLMLQDTMFPVGDLTKREVKDIALMAGLHSVARKRESMGLCFVGKRKFSNFIAQYIEEKEGTFVSVDGRIMGCHNGHHLYTIGQRARLGGHRSPWFVVGKDNLTNTVTVAEGENHPALYCHSFYTDTPTWVLDTPPDLFTNRTMTCMVQCRHQQPLMPCKVELVEGLSALKVSSASPFRAVTPGQYAVFYTGEECVGGACISAAGPSLWDKHKNKYTICLTNNTNNKQQQQTS